MNKTISDFFIVTASLWIALVISVVVILLCHFCPCGHWFESDSAYCSSCGVQLQKICPDCGHAFRSGAYCNSCGTYVPSN